MCQTRIDVNLAVTEPAFQPPSRRILAVAIASGRTNLIPCGGSRLLSPIATTSTGFIFTGPFSTHRARLYFQERARSTSCATRRSRSRLRTRAA